MKKFLLSLAAFAMAFSASATSYKIFDIANPGEWTGGASGWNSTIVVDGKTFTIETSKYTTTATDLIAPNANSYAWRIYKNSQAVITSQDVDMKQVIITYDDYENGKYCLELTLSSGWTGQLSGVEYTLVSAGLKSLTMIAEEGQVRIKEIVVSDEEGDITPPVGPSLPEGVVYQNSFEENMDGWVKINKEGLDDDMYSGWKINNKEPKCAIANSYYSGKNHAANARMQYTVDLTNYEDCKVSFDQAFGYFFPTEQNDYFLFYVIPDGSETQTYLAMVNFPAAPASGNWTKEWATNTFDISEYDGTKLTVGFEYNNPGGEQSMAWEVKNFVVTGDKANAVEGLAADNAPAVYYNLQGVRVNAPEKGLFIVVKGGKSTKVVL